MKTQGWCTVREAKTKRAMTIRADGVKCFLDAVPPLILNVDFYFPPTNSGSNREYP